MVVDGEIMFTNFYLGSITSAVCDMQEVYYEIIN